MVEVNLKPLVSVVIPCFKNGDTISKAISSVIAQSYKNIEIIVVDDCSPLEEGIEAKVRAFSGITYIRNSTNLGAAAARNVGIDAASGEYLSFLDADDFYHSSKIELQLRYANSNTVVTCGAEIFYDCDDVKESELSKDSPKIEIIRNGLRLYFRNSLVGAAILVHKSLIMKVGGYSEVYLSCEDHDLWFKLLSARANIVDVKLPLYFYRFNENGLSKNLSTISQWEFEVIKSNLLQSSTHRQHFTNLIFTNFVIIFWTLKHLIRADRSNRADLIDSSLKRARVFFDSNVLYFLVQLIYVFGFIKAFRYIVPENNKNNKNFDQTVGIFDSIGISDLSMWLIFFCYSLLIAICFQLYLPELFPSLHAGNGLLSQDAIYFHNSAITLAEEIGSKGWVAWRPWPSFNTTGNVSILGAIYNIFGYKPLLILPINAALHASSGLMLAAICKKLFKNSISAYAILVASCIYIVSPSALNWYAQNHKDGYAGLGFFMIFLAGIRLFDSESYKNRLITLLIFIIGLGLTIFVRPNNLQLFMILGFGMLFLSILLFRRNGVQVILYIAYAALIFSSASYFKMVPEQSHKSPVNISIGFADAWEWKKSPEIPEIIDNTFQKIANIRVFIAANAIRDGARSMIDLNRMPDNVYGCLEYLPISALNGLLAPIPSTWSSGNGIFWFVGLIEIILWYLMIPGFVVMIWCWRRSAVFWWAIASLVMLIGLESFLSSNLGTLHRIRHPFLFLLNSIGVIGWFKIWKALFKTRLKDSENTFNKLEIQEISTLSPGQMKRPYKIILLMATTGILFISLFYRDIMLANTFGFNATLDAFQNSANLPLAVTTLFAVPLFQPLIYQFCSVQSTHQTAAKKWVQATSAKLLLTFFIIGAIVATVGKQEVLGTHPDLSNYINYFFLPIVTLSGLTVLGNAILVANNRPITTVIFQIITPWMAILLTILAPEFGVLVPIFGLLFGQIINLIFVAYFCNKLGYSLKPNWGSISWEKWKGVYLSMVISSMSMNLGLPIAIYFSSGFTVGSVSQLYTASKLFLALTVLFSTVYYSIYLPFFIKIKTLYGDLLFQKYLRVVLFASCYLISLIVLVLYAYINNIIEIIFYGKEVTLDQIESIELMVKYGLLQLPFVSIMVVLTNHLIISKRLTAVVISSLVGQLTNILIAHFAFSLNFGVEVLSAGMTLGFIVSSLILLIYSKGIRILGWKDLVLVILILFSFLVSAQSIVYSSVLGIYFTSSIFLIITILFYNFRGRNGFSRFNLA